MTEQEALQVLNAVPGLGGVRIHGLRECFGNAVAVLQQPYEELAACGVVPLNVVENIIHFSKDKFLIDEYNLLAIKNVALTTIADEGYPHLLRNIPGAPVVLYIKGDQTLLHSAAVAMVGSRACSYYGKAQAVLFAESFARAGLTVISGMARGIDTCAHQGCLKAGGNTIAVLGCGLNYIYPRENQQLMEAIIASGAVVSEMPLNTPPIPANFPRRNRIITGLSLATVVIEAGEKSGALISSGYALEQGRDVFALPANIDYATARGSNQLLKDGAQIALSPQDVLEVLRGQVELVFPEVSKQAEEPRVFINELEAKVYKILTTEPVHADELAARTKLSIGQIAQVVLHLQLKELAKELPGKYFIKENNGKITSDR